MALATALDQIRQASRGKIPEEARAVMQRAEQSLRDSGILDGVISPGARAPSFLLPDADGITVGLDGLMQQRWLVLSFFRGVW